MRRRTFVGAGIGLLTGCSSEGLAGRNWDLRYRITVRVAVGGRTYSGASAFRSVFRKIDSRLDDLATARFSTRVWGEAIAVEIEDRGWLLGTLGAVFGVNTDHQLSLDHDRAITRVLPAQVQSLDAFETGALYDRLRALEGEHPLPPVLWPIFLMLADIRDLSSASAVPVPGHGYRFGRGVQSISLGRAFGTNARIEDVSFEVTQDQVMRRIERIAPWLDQLEDRQSERHTREVSMPLEQTLKYRNFVLKGE